MKTFPGRNSFFATQRGFTLIELLVVVAIIAVLTGISLPVLSAIRKKGRMVTEISAARQLVAGYLSYATENDGELMPGHLAGASVKFPNGDTVAGPEAERYPWRLAPYLRWNAEGIYILEGNQDSFRGKVADSSEYRYMVSLAPALGLNAYCVGGYVTTSSLMAKNDVATKLGQIERPANLVAFVSARTKTSASSTSGDIGGSFYVRPPVYSSVKWKTGAYEAKNASLDYGNVDFRHGRKAVTSFLDGSVRLMGIEELRDMQLWSRNADSANYSVRP